jgi:hypothetical protein
MQCRCTSEQRQRSVDQLHPDAVEGVGGAREVEHVEDHRLVRS